MRQLYTQDTICDNRTQVAKKTNVSTQINSVIRVLFITGLILLTNWDAKASGVIYGTNSATLSGTVYDLSENYDPDYGGNVKHGYWEINIPSGTIVNVNTMLDYGGTLVVKDQSNYYFYNTGAGTFKPVGNKIYVYYDIYEWDENYHYLSSEHPIFELNAQFESLTTNDNLYLKNGNLYCDGVLKQINNYGYVQIGAQNSAGAYINTDMPRFYFNKPIHAITGEFSAYSSNNLSLQTNGTTRMTVLQSNGNVGIGTTSPNAKLDVGTCLTNGQKGVVFGHLTEGNTTGDGTFLGVVGYGTSPTYSKSFSIEHHFYGQTNSSINFFRGGSTDGGFITFNTYNNSERMRINPEGNVGIGITSPGAKLDVVSGVNAYPATSGSTQTGGALRLHGGDNAVMDFGMYSTNTWIQATDQTNLGMNYNLSLNPNGGNVGIGTGTSSPTEKLSVIGAIYASDGYRVNDTRTVNDQPQQKPSRAISYDFKTRSSVNTPDLDISASSEYAHIMTVAGWSTNEGSGGWPMQLSFGANGIGIRQAINATTWGSWKKTIVADQIGNVGIGTATPNKKLEVNTNHAINIDDEIRIGSYYNNNFYGLGLNYSIDGNGSPAQHIVTYSAGSKTKNISLYTNGNVGIGTTTLDPSGALLSVNGTIHAKEVKVDLNGLADFVFSPTYRLRPLHEVEQFVKTNNHLPEIPSAAEVKDKGMNMGEMQNKLLQKVEELTLYVIEQQKQIEALKKELKK